jgi:hypothetical protein
MFQAKGKTDEGQDLSVFEAPEITAQEYTEHTAGVIANFLEATGLVEVREIQANLVNQVHLLCRVKDANARTVAQKLVKAILVRAEVDGKIEAFIGKQFILKDGKLLYAWVFSFACEDLKRMAQVVCDAIEEAVPKRKIEVVESPLMGPGTPRSYGPGSRGASPLKG